LGKAILRHLHAPLRPKRVYKGTRGGEAASLWPSLLTAPVHKLGCKRMNMNANELRMNTYKPGAAGMSHQQPFLVATNAAHARICRHPKRHWPHLLGTELLHLEANSERNQTGV
jgi:hypothetical protein